MTFLVGLRCLAFLAAVLSLQNCAARPEPSFPEAIELPSQEPLPEDIKPLTVEQEETTQDNPQ